LTNLDERRPEDLEDPAHALWGVEVRHLVGCASSQDLARAFGGGLEPHLLEEVPESSDGEDRHDLMQSTQVRDLRLERHQGW
jgi:hypothetical protein